MTKLSTTPDHQPPADSFQQQPGSAPSIAAVLEQVVATERDRFATASSVLPPTTEPVRSRLTTGSFPSNESSY